MVRIDLILAILAVLISLPGLAAVFPFLDLTARVTAIAALAGAVAGARFGFVLRGVMSTVLTIAFFFYYGIQFSRDNVVQPAVNLLVILLCVRLVSEKSPRNYLQLFALALFVLAGSSLYSLDATFLLYLVLLIFLIAVALVILTFYASDASILLSRDQMRKIVSVALLLPTASVPLMLFFFVVMPRTQYPLWDFLNRGNSGAGTGLSESVRPGSTPSVSEVKTVAFRAAGPQLDRGRLYWRGIVFNTFRDGSWIREAPPERATAPAAVGHGLAMTVFPEPRQGAYMVTLNLPQRVDGVRVRKTGDLVFTSLTPLDRRVKYTTLSVPVETLKVREEIDRAFYLRLPDRLPPRIAALGRQIAAGGGSIEERIARTADFYRSSRIRYATTGLPTGEDALDAFLFTRRSGHCELFASSLAVVLRLAGVPCRLVGGYYGGVYSEMGGYYVVTEDMAHVWVEAFIPGKGWMTLDPSSWAVGFAGRNAGSGGLMNRLKMSVDAFNYFWNLAVITYDLEKQVRLFSAAGEQVRRVAVDTVLLGKILGVSVAVAAGIVAAGYGKRRRRSKEERVLEKFLALVAARFAVRRDPSMGLHDLARAVKHPDVDAFVERYTSVVFRDQRLRPPDVRHLEEILARIRRSGPGGVAQK